MIHPILIIVLILLTVLISALVNAWIRNRVFGRAYRALTAQDYPAFFREVDGKGMKSMFSEYVRDSLKLTAYMEQKDTQKVTETFNRMMKHKISDAQKGDLLIRGFQYYAAGKDAGKVRTILEKMEEILNEELAAKYRRHYEILFGKSAAYITELEKEVPLHQNRMKGYLQYLLARSYRNEGREKECLTLLREAAAEYRVPAGKLDEAVQVL